jgi:hypothetical protein
VGKIRKIEDQLARIEQRLANAEEYVARNVNVESTSFLHFIDWQGKSGHPSWMRNHMIPTMKKVRASKEKAQERIAQKAKEKATVQRLRLDRLRRRYDTNLAMLG